MNNKIMKLGTLAVPSVTAFMALGWSFFEMTVRCEGSKKQNRKKWFQFSHTKINHPRHKFEQIYESGKAWCYQQHMTDYYIRSDDGLLLHSYFLPAKDAERIIILCHGYKGSGFGDFANIAKFLHENHCNLLFIDERCCGQSEGKFITFGAKEQHDILGWTNFISRKNKNHLPIYLYGESMGAASVLMASGHFLPKEVRGIIADCGFRSMKAQLQDMAANWFHLKRIELLLIRENIFCLLIGGFRMKDADTTNAMLRNKRPILFFHGEKDTYVDPKNSRYNYSICKAPKELVIIPEARHLCSAYEQPELYRKKLLEFFAKYDTRSN